MQIKEYSHTPVNSDKEIKLIFSDFAENANGSVIVECSNTKVLLTAVMSKNDSDLDYFPLKVEFEERFYSVGAILGSRFLRREGRPSTDAVLKARIIDRTIRPLFPKGLKKDIQIIATTVAIGDVDPDFLSVLGTSVALGVSEIPWNGPASSVKLGLINGKWKAFPTINEEETVDSLLFLCGTNGKVNMVEMEGNEVSESSLKEAFKMAEEILRDCNEFQTKVIKKEMKAKKSEMPSVEIPKAVEVLFDNDLKKLIKKELLENGKDGIENVQEYFQTLIQDLEDSDKKIANGLLQDEINSTLQKQIIEKGVRIDGRKPDEIRPLFAQAGKFSNVVHGSGIFYRGGTHILSVLTLGGPEDALLVDSVDFQDTKINFIHHYNFPPFSAGETGRVGGFNRREIGHGMLAEKALRPSIPNQNEFPYTVRIVSEVISSDGSSSMGSVCASTLALMDGGVPIKSPVAGIAMGLAYENDKYVVLTDVAGIEDFRGFMDLKVAGTVNGINAIQMDVKLDGIPFSVLEEGIEKAKLARGKILDMITKEISSPRSEISERAPLIEVIKIETDEIGLLIGSQGKTIKGIKESTGVGEITIEEDGTVYVTGQKDSVKNAIDKIKLVLGHLNKGDRFEGKVSNIVSFGAFVEIAAGVEGLVHISEISKDRIDTVESVLSVGDIVPVVVKGVGADKKISLSIKDADPSFIKNHAKRKKSK